MSRARMHVEISLLTDRFKSTLAMIYARIPRTALGLQVLLGGVVLVGAVWLFGGVSEDVISGDPLTVMDAEVATWFHTHAAPEMTRAMLWITNANGLIGISVLVVVMAIIFIRRKEWFWLKALLLAVPGGMLLNVATKLAFSRARPHFDQPILTLVTYSYPSGHVAAATMFYATLALYLARKAKTWKRRFVILLCAFLIIFLVALSRVYLGAHYLSDVLAAFAEGVAWVILCVTSLHAFEIHRSTSRSL